MNDKERDITIIFLDVMDIVKAKRELARMESHLIQQCMTYGVDRRIANILANEYEKTLENHNYKMKTVSEIQEELKQLIDKYDRELM